MKLTVAKPNQFKGVIRVPSDKSLTHRAFMFSAITTDRCVVREPLKGEDPMSTLSCLGLIGLRSQWLSETEVALTPPHEWEAPEADLDCGNSGTTIRLLAGLVGSHPFKSRLIGDASLSRRPMGRIATPLGLMGITVEGDTPPLTIHGVAEPRAVDYVSPVASAQVKSCVLLSGLRAEGPCSVTEPSRSRDHTEKMLNGLGATVETETFDDGRYKATVFPIHRLDPFEIVVPGDISSAAFLMVAAAMVPGSHVELTDVGVNPTRTGIFDVFDQASLFYEVIEGTLELGEPKATVVVGHRVEDLRTPFTIEGPLVPRLIDEIPVLAVLATQLNGTSVIRDAKELRVKETDRLEVVADGLRRMGASVETFDDGMAITGPVKLQGTKIDAAGDHRIGMAFAVAGLVAEGETVIDNADSIATSYPSFESHIRRLSGV